MHSATDVAVVCNVKNRKLTIAALQTITHGSAPKHIQWVISSSRTVFMNKNSGRIRALSWYLIIAHQSHNNKNDHLTRPESRSRVSTHEYLDTITLGVLINNYYYGKSQVRLTRDFLFVDLRKVLNLFTSRLLRVSCRYL